MKNHASQAKRSSTLDLVAIIALIALSLVGFLYSTNLVFNENLTAYAACNEFPRTGCSNSGWLSSMGLAFAGGVVIVVAGAVLSIRRWRRGRIGTWFPAAAIVALAVLTGIALLILRVITAG